MNAEDEARNLLSLSKTLDGYHGLLDSVSGLSPMTGSRIAICEARISLNNIKAELERRERLIKALDDYIVLLGAELSDQAGFLAVHHWQSKRVEEGKLAREKIEEIRSQ